VKIENLIILIFTFIDEIFNFFHFLFFLIWLTDQTKLQRTIDSQQSTFDALMKKRERERDDTARAGEEELEKV
jgi:hypothetical protein